MWGGVAALLLPQAAGRPRRQAAVTPAARTVELEEVGVELGQGGPVRDGQQGHTKVLCRLHTRQDLLLHIPAEDRQTDTTN